MGYLQFFRKNFLGLTFLEFLLVIISSAFIPFIYLTQRSNPKIFIILLAYLLCNVSFIFYSITLRLSYDSAKNLIEAYKNYVKALERRLSKNAKDDLDKDLFWNN